MELFTHNQSPREAVDPARSTAATYQPALASTRSSQPNSRPIGRLPTPPRKSFATGRSKNAKPIVAPYNAKLMIVGCQGKMPSNPSVPSAAVIGTTSTTVIQSRPSVKFTRLTNPNRPTRQNALAPPRKNWQQTQLRRRCRQQCGHSERLEHEPRRRSDVCPPSRRRRRLATRRYRRQPAVRDCACLTKDKQNAAGYDERRSSYRDAAALRRLRSETDGSAALRPENIIAKARPMTHLSPAAMAGLAAAPNFASLHNVWHSDNRFLRSCRTQ